MGFQHGYAIGLAVLLLIVVGIDVFQGDDPTLAVLACWIYLPLLVVILRSK